MKKRVLSLLLALVMVVSLLPVTVLAVGGQDGQVHVLVENTTWAKADGAPWEGTLVDEWITLKADSTMMSCVKDALEKNHYSYVANASVYGEYLSEVNDLSEVDGGSQAGWMGTLNDWFTNASFSAFTVADGTLVSGDEIRVMYTKNGYGADIGGDWSTQSNTALAALRFSSGTLTPAFDKDVHEYTLELTSPADVTVMATAANKCNQVYLSVGETSYRRSAAVPMENGTVLTLRCGDAAEATEYAPAVVPTTYTVTVKAGAPTAKVTVRSQAAGAYLHGIETVEVSADLAESYGFTDAVDGVSALDVLVRAHELTFGEDFTKKTASDYLSVGSSGWVTLAFGMTEGFGFFVNESYPNDGTESAYGGYNGTFVTNTAVKSGDTVDFFLYQDGEAWTDYYTWIDAPSVLASGENVTVTVKGFYAVSAYLYKDAASLKAAAKALEGVQLGWLEPSTGAVSVIKGAVTDENGVATFVADKSASGYLVALSDSDEEVYAIMNPTAKLAVLSKVNVTFRGLHSAQLASLKVYSYENGVKGAADLLDGVSTLPDDYKLKYETALLPGDYFVEGYDANGDCNGSIVVTVGAEDCTFVLQRIYEIYATNSGWKLGTDYTVSYTETAPDGTKRTTALGTADNSGTTRPSALFIEGDTLKVTLTPIGEKAADYLPIDIVKSGSQTTNQGALSFSAAIPQGLEIKVTAPAGSTVVTGTFGNYYSYTFFDPEKTTDNGDGTLTAFFRVPTTNLNHFLRVQNPEGVTYWTFAKWTAAQNLTVTRADLHMDDEISSSSVFRFERNVHDRADVYLNINRQGYKNLSVGETFELDVIRNWQAIESYVNAQIALPDAHYQVLDLNGKPSDLLTITPDAHNSSLATVKANREGTAIVLVTYDAMTHMQGQSSTADKTFSAIWPECTGVFVVSVGADGSAIATNMKLERPGVTGTLTDDKLALDAEHDTLFYLGSEGASYTFTPESGCTVSIARSTVGKTMTFSGFTTEGVTVDAESGAVTLTGLTTGRHIVRIEKNGVATYQVITARQVRYELLDADGNVLPENTEFKAGDTVTVQFHDLLSPKEKNAGAYNHSFMLYYRDENGHSFQSKAAAFGGMYDFNGNPERQKLTLTIPADVTGTAYVLNGAIRIGGFSGAPSHRGASYNSGMDRQYGTSTAGVMSLLPELTIKLEGYAVAETERLIDAIGEVTLDSEEAIAAARKAFNALTEEQQAQVKNSALLTAAETALAALKKAEQAEIDLVEAKIAAIGSEVTLDSEKTIAAAREAFDALTEAQQARVKNYAVLTAAERALADLKLAALLEHIYTTTGDYLAGLGTPSVGSVGGDWLAFGLARSGRTVPEGYYEAVVNYVKEHADANERLHRSKSTDNSRLILALTAIGRDVTNVGGHNLLKGLDSMDYICKQGINGPVFALLALDCHVYPVSGDVTREKLVQTILDAALENGGWALDDKAADADMTAMAIQALAPYYESNEAVKAAVEQALTVLSGMQLSDGGFASFGDATSESNAQVIVALTALGIDPAADSRFIKNGKTVLDALASYYVEGGGFMHTADGKLDGMATEQGYYALAAYYRLLNEQSSLYDMREVTIKTEPATPVKPETPKTGDSGVAVWMLALSVSALAAVLVLTAKKRKTE